MTGNSPLSFPTNRTLIILVVLLVVYVVLRCLHNLRHRYCAFRLRFITFMFMRISERVIHRSIRITEQIAILSSWLALSSLSTLLSMLTGYAVQTRRWQAPGVFLYYCRYCFYCRYVYVAFSLHSLLLAHDCRSNRGQRYDYYLRPSVMSDHHHRAV